ncbi:MAG: hypothetical protein APF80_11930 [Alphaproteobacteria bacterium BRH_c36]|nr:MAG: hypothetical protein APF80_11930 [Alphaproteobacteria bacterium BRH_c36]
MKNHVDHPDANPIVWGFDFSSYTLQEQKCAQMFLKNRRRREAENERWEKLFDELEEYGCMTVVQRYFRYRFWRWWYCQD